jgi:hypothetical protein
MRLLSAEEDFHRYTLDKIDGVLARAHYFVSLKEADGTLYHWGLQRQYGAAKASEVLNHTFAEQLQTLLQERLAALWDEARICSQKASIDSECFLGTLRRDLEKVAQLPLTELQKRHLKSVLDALFEVAAHQRSKPSS